LADLAARIMEIIEIWRVKIILAAFGGGGYTGIFKNGGWPLAVFLYSSLFFLTKRSLYMGFFKGYRNTYRFEPQSVHRCRPKVYTGMP
jgi:hypothetical protein